MHKAKFQRIAKNFAYDFDLSRIDRRHLSSYCKFMGINDYGPQFILKKRLEKYMDYLDQDDKLLLQDNTVDTLTVQELSHAVEERGMKSVDQQEENMRRALKYWLSASQADPKVPADPPLPEENTFIEPYVPRKRPRLTEDQLKSHSVTVNYDRIANADLGLFRRVHRHLDNVTETLSPISTRSNNSFSRFDRIFDMDTFKSKSHSVVSSLRDHSLRDDISEVTKSETSKSEASMLNRLKTMQERITVFERPQSSFTQRLEEHQTTKPPPSSIERPLEPLLEEPVAYEQQQDTHTSMDNNLSPSKPSSPALSAKGKEKED
ncbi:hypothetical protein CU098_004820, partial [Rhizopus stolonifer]